ncbi:MAG TPA: TolC family outer membrane protein, partial [Rhodanobacteraceae bacterium]|nr:TolC family outer membrane protein [Rhodanobacteraceae bacterium]
MKATSLRIKLLPFGLALGLATVTGSAAAEDLLHVYQQARQADPTLAQANSQRLAVAEGIVQSRAALLPQISAGVDFRRNQGNGGSSSFIGDDGQVVDSGSRWSRSLSGSLNMTLLDFGRYANIKASRAASEAQNEQFTAAEQDLIIRVSQAYFDVLGARDNLDFADAQEKALARQLDQAQQRFDVGLSAITDVNEAKANHDASTADVINAKNTLADAREALTQITGQPIGTLDVLREELPMQPPQPDNEKAWVDQALHDNPYILAQQYQVEASEHDISAARAAHLPTLGGSVNYSRALGNQPAGYDRSSTTVGFAISVPIFAGGATQSRVRQSIYQRDAAQDVLEQNRRQVVRNTRNAYRSVIAGISEVDARKQAVVSAKSALDAT